MKTDFGQNSYTAASIESEGAPGEKEPMPGQMSLEGGGDGNYGFGPQAAFNATKGAAPGEDVTIPALVETDEPTKAEGATGMVEYPKPGVPSGTTSVGVSGASGYEN